MLLQTLTIWFTLASGGIANRVSVFTPEGRFVTSFGRTGSRPGEFKGPCGIAIDDSGMVYVSDSENNRIQVF